MLPGPSTLKVQVKDFNRLIDLKADELIGETFVDIEDRWFHTEWQGLDTPDPAASTSANADKAHLKPVEVCVSWGVMVCHHGVSSWCVLKPPVEGRAPRHTPRPSPHALPLGAAFDRGAVCDVMS